MTSYIPKHRETSALSPEASISQSILTYRGYVIVGLVSRKYSLQERRCLNTKTAG